MKNLLDCDRGEKVKVSKLNAAYDLKQRLISFGIMKDAELEVLAQAPRKKTIEVKVGKMRLALRSEEAAQIEVKKI
ncbi:FeoA family protein [Sulfurimonas sp.]|uniref:FeoA family protein n=1 Tax=Sulfurimonas sp. TaxID=2022749 RepID=UPI002616B53D|nr:FeoA family protein [Sulfurimonas sp.]